MVDSTGSRASRAVWTDPIRHTYSVLDPVTKLYLRSILPRAKLLGTTKSGELTAMMLEPGN